MKKYKKGVALLIVMVMILLFTIVGGGVMLYSRSSTEVGYREVRKTKAYYAAEAGLQRGLYAAYAGQGDGTLQISVGAQWVTVNYTITTNPDGTKTVSASVSNMSNIRLYFPEP